MTDFKLRAVVTENDTGYVVSVSRVSVSGQIMILAEDDVDSLAAAHEIMSKVATDCSYPAGKVDKIYNIQGKITKRPPRGLA